MQCTSASTSTVLVGPHSDSERCTLSLAPGLRIIHVTCVYMYMYSYSGRCIIHVRVHTSTSTCADSQAQGPPDVQRTARYSNSCTRDHVRVRVLQRYMCVDTRMRCMLGAAWPYRARARACPPQHHTQPHWRTPRSFARPFQRTHPALAARA